uniref:Uncharacterized protein n=1 Tax=Anguilla anguilla TaxID=7936 RepID=A0A0E9UNJ0_ANGAN
MVENWGIGVTWDRGGTRSKGEFALTLGRPKPTMLFVGPSSTSAHIAGVRARGEIRRWYNTSTT